MMRRRSWLKRGGAVATGALLWSPMAAAAAVANREQGHDAYFTKLNQLLRRDGPGRPVMLIDIAAMRHNVSQLVASVGKDKTYRVVVKSLPSVPLLKSVMRQANTDALMVFHQPFLNEIALQFPRADVLLGKPMPVNAARTFYARLPRRSRRGFQPHRQLQWLIDSGERLQQYQQLARELGVRMRINFELDVGLHRGGLSDPRELRAALELIEADPKHLEFAGLMGYEPHLTGLAAELDHPAVAQVLNRYRSFISESAQRGYDPQALTLNGAGSHTLKIYERDNTMNDLSAGSGVVLPTDFDTHHLRAHRPALFIATPILKRYAGNPYAARVPGELPENMQRLYYIYGGYWKAQMVSPPNTGKPIYESTNQSPITTTRDVDLQVDDYMFLRPTQSESVMLQFGDLLTVERGELSERWPVFQQTG